MSEDPYLDQMLKDLAEAEYMLRTPRSSEKEQENVDRLHRLIREYLSEHKIGEDSE